MSEVLTALSPDVLKIEQRTPIDTSGLGRGAEFDSFCRHRGLKLWYFVVQNLVSNYSSLVPSCRILLCMDERVRKLSVEVCGLCLIFFCV